MSRRIQIFDTTLRDGEQSPGIALQPHEKAEIAEQLERLGVDVIEAGFAGASPGDFEGVRAVAAAVYAADRRLARARTRERTSTPPPRRSPTRARSRIHIVLGTSAIHMEKKLGLEPEEVVEHAAGRVEIRGRARRRGRVLVRGRNPLRPRVRRARLPRRDRAGATIDQPARHRRLRAARRVRRVHRTTCGRRCPELRAVTLSVHCHNDLGLAVANSLAGIEAGAQQVECTVNGIGERAGNASLEEIVMALSVRADSLPTSRRASTRPRSPPTSRLVSRRTGYVVQPNKAIVGANAFAHEAGIHQDGMLKDARTYQIIDPGDVGVRMTLPLGKHSGRHAFCACVRGAGLELEGDELDGAFRRFKERADAGGARHARRRSSRRWRHEPL